MTETIRTGGRRAGRTSELAAARERAAIPPQPDELHRPGVGVREPSLFERATLLGLSRKRQGQVYEGTVDPVTVAERRAENKRARASRRANRRH